MKQMSLIEMDGFLKGKCIPRDLKVNETTAEYLVRKFAEAEAKCAALAAENAMLKQRTQQLIDIISNTDNDYCMCGSAMKDHVHSGCGYPTGMFDYYYNQWLESDNKTPATDAFLAEVRAQGVEMAACALDDVNQFNYANMLDDLAQKLRKDSNTADPLAAGIITEVGD
ncbi:hypothetical protein J3219_002227 [Escherichia coli]|nr:hypothetical protein [Escherichia coli]